jgi:hypothetical protein
MLLKPDHRHSSKDAGIQCQGWHYIEYIPVTGFWHPCQNDLFYTYELITMNLLTIPNHAELDTGTCKAIMRQASRYISSDELYPYFYTE